MLGEYSEDEHLVAFDKWGNKGKDDGGGVSKGIGLSAWAVDD